MKTPIALLLLLSSCLPLSFSHDFDIDVPSSDDTPSLILSNGSENQVYRIERSTDLNEWWPIFGDYGPQWNFPLSHDFNQEQIFYNAVESLPPVVPSHASWKTSITFPDDPFKLQIYEPQFFDDDAISLIKFIILRDDLTHIYFQNSQTYNYHYNFATERINQFHGLNTDEFNRKTLYNANLEAILGNVIFAPEFNEYGIQFIAIDTIPKETLLYLYNLVDSSISKPDGSKGFYTPSYRQTQLAEREEEWFNTHGIDISSTNKWEVRNSAYNPSWAYGTLVYFPGDEIEEAYENGTLGPNDILLTENLPAEVPYLQGIVTLSPASSNSHVSLLAEASGIPFGYASDSDLQEQLKSLVGQNIVLQVSGAASSLNGSIFARSFPDTLPENLQQELNSRKALPEIEIEEMQPYGAYTKSVDTLTPADIKYFGGKAANFGFLRRAIPSNSPEAIAISFDLWIEFLDQSIDGTPLRSYIDSLLTNYSWPVSNLPQLKADLDSIRDLIEDRTEFSSTQESAIIAALSSFDSGEKIRFRSSTNVEDSAHFIGAGLYDSYSGCLLDDLDDDDLGPSLCDSTKENERGVFRAIRKVFASFYNDNAFLERLRYGIDESTVGMALLVHHSFPDEIELANGVARAEYSNIQNYRRLDIYLSTQVGAHSVTNPDPSMVAEKIHCPVYSTRIYCYINQRSNLLPLGESYVLDWEDEYKTLSTLLEDALDEYLKSDPDRETLTLDFEYKKLAPDGQLIIKQIREIPQNHSGDGLPWIIDETQSNEYRIHQGESGGDVFAIHRLKSTWKLSAHNKLLDSTGLETPLLKEVEWQQLDASGNTTKITGTPSTWTNASQEATESYGDLLIKESWQQATIQAPKTTFTLTARTQAAPTSQQLPLKTASGFSWSLNANYQSPVISIDQMTNATFATTQEDYVLLEFPPSPIIPDNAIPRHHEITSSDHQISVDIKHWWPDGPGPVNGYTAPLLHWDRTIITGLTSTPITLTGYYSQTYKPQHHNFGEWFLFEPALEEGITDQQRTELENAHIRKILVFTDDNNSLWLFDQNDNRIE